MKKHSSVFMLMTRNVLYQVLFLMAAMACVQGAAFWVTLRRIPSAAQSGLWNGNSLEAVVVQSRVHWIFIGFFLLVTLVLSVNGCHRGSKMGYTLRRLSVSEETVFLWQTACNACCYLLLWAAEVMVMLALCKLFTATADPSVVSGQTIFLAFYRNEFLHSLLPLEDILRWVRNGTGVLCLALSAACFPFRQRRGSRGGEILFLAALTAAYFADGLDNHGFDVIAIVLMGAVAAEACVYVFTEEAEDDA